MTLVLGILLAIFVVAASYSLYASFSTPYLMTLLLGLAGNAVAFLKALSTSNLRVYFWFERLRIWWLSDSVTRWWFAAGFDGDFAPTVVHDLVAHLHGRRKFRFSVSVDYLKDREVQIDIDKTLTLKIGFDPPTLSASGKGHISLLSKTLEVSYGHARKKIESQIIPVIHGLKEFLNPDSSSYDLNVEFPERNPFFAVYVAHLKPEQIGDFRVVLHLDAYSASPRPEVVEISRSNLHLTSQSTDSFVRLAEDFILLSVDTKMLSGARVGA
ncbi:MAG TPA: hypothetical protein VGS15_05505 [Candidatus Acidoferrales bacterium]|nr:hypothetical protein [Candidatus Acidoferrales bacterium]